MKYKDLPERWKLKLEQYLISLGVNDRKELSVYEFNKQQTIKIKFEDDSFAHFKYAFMIEAIELNEVGIFTEHCGYHIFVLSGNSFNIIE